jgi:general stress protein 26
MASTVSEGEKRQRLSELVSKFDTAMLVTRTDGAAMRARPLSVASSGEGGDLYFSTAIESPKVRELEVDPHVAVVMQDGKRYVSISGVAHVVRDRALIDRLWSESWKIWFPQGKDDPSLCLLHVEPTEAAYWDLSGLEGVKYAFQMAKGFLTGTRPSSDDDPQHTARLKL